MVKRDTTRYYLATDVYLDEPGDQQLDERLAVLAGDPLRRSI